LTECVLTRKAKERRKEKANDKKSLIEMWRNRDPNKGYYMWNRDPNKGHQGSSLQLSPGSPSLAEIFYLKLNPEAMMFRVKLDF